MTLARFAKIAAVLVVALMLWRARTPSVPIHVAVVALPGASSDLFVGGEHSRTLARGPISMPPGTTGASFWRRLFATSDDAESPGALWTDENAAVRVVAVPASLVDGNFSESTKAAFAGSSAGALVEAEDLTSGRLPSPYDRAADAVVAAAATLGRDQWSEWIAVEPPPGTAKDAQPPLAHFQFVHVSDSSYYFSPAYAFEASPFVHRPFLRGKEREIRPLVAAHAIAATRRRFETARALVEAGDTRPLLMFDTATEDAMAVFAPDTTPAGVLEQLRESISAEVRRLRQPDGPKRIVIAVGGPTTGRPAETPAWYQIVELGSAPDSGGIASRQLDFAAARTMMRYALGLAVDEQQIRAVPPELVEAVPVEPSSLVAAAPATKPQTRTPWSAETLESVPGAVTSGR